MKYRILFLLAILIIAAGKTSACSCMEVSVAENLASSDIVFKGKVISKVTTTNFDSLNITLEKIYNDRLDFNSIPVTAVSIEVKTLYKGYGSDTITIITPSNGAACGVRFDVGKDYIVYATNDMRQPYTIKNKCYKNKIFWTHLCTRTDIWYGEEERAIKKELKKQKDESGKKA